MGSSVNNGVVPVIHAFVPHRFAGGRSQRRLHHPRGAMLDPGGALRVRGVCLDRAARRLQPQQCAQRAFPLAHHGHRLCLAFERDARLPPPFPRQPQAIQRPGIRRDILCRQPPFGRIGRQQGRDRRRRRPIPPRQSCRRLRLGRRQGAAQNMHDLLKHLLWQQLREIGRGPVICVHPGSLQSF